MARGAKTNREDSIVLKPRRIGFKNERQPRRARLARIATILGASFAILIILAGSGAFYFYSHYAAIVDRRIASGFWYSRGGVYAVPKRLRAGGRATLDSVVDALKRSGYVESATADEVFNGSFTVNGNVLEIKSSARLATAPETTAITFTGNKVSKITSDGSMVDEYLVEPELLIGRTASKRSGNRVLEYDAIPADLRNAIMAAEDRRFFEHYGIDPRSIGRALIRNLKENEIRQGGSTITQQLVKNTFLSPERSFSRKFAEAFLSIALERRLSKEQIFALYCNEIYLGQYGSAGVHGVEQAARVYFGKDLANLTLGESAAIAAMIKNPNRYGPHKDADAAKARRDSIIASMTESGTISGDEALQAKDVPITLIAERKEGNSIAPYFVDAATQEIGTKFDGDYLNANFNTRVYTTIDVQLQKLAEKAVADQLAKLDRVYGKKGKKLEASIVALDPHTGHVLAMVGGRDYAGSQFNRATSALRQPGSTFKPIVYAAALERGFTPISTFADRPMEFMHTSTKPYKPANFRDGYSMKNLTLKTALTKSSNVVAVQTAYAVGLHRVAEQAEELGFKNVPDYPSIALGAVEVTPLQLAAAYATFANGGTRVVPAFVDQIVSGSDTTLYVTEPDEHRVVTAKTAYMITDMLQAVVERGTARSANGALGRNVTFAGKTGSSKDGWFVGYTPNLVTVAWIGFDDNTDVRSTGGEIALPLWTEFMQAVVAARPELGGREFPMPNGVAEVVVDPETGMLADRYCPMSEKVVLPTYAVSNIKCLLHQPQPDYLLAMNATEGSDLPPAVITIQTATEWEVEKPSEPTDSTYFDDAEKLEQAPKRKQRKHEDPDEPAPDERSVEPSGRLKRDGK